ncbi:hypothetical protein BKA60DRAFT_18122 [Fusarium oxysporum]|nr:hypothetical protein BKA60DRAFT_18122 [Fusarium oxysporum]
MFWLAFPFTCLCYAILCQEFGWFSERNDEWYCAHITCSRFLGGLLTLVFGNGKNREGQGNERNGLDIRPRMVAPIYILASITVLINVYYADAKSISRASL